MEKNIQTRKLKFSVIEVRQAEIDANFPIAKQVYEALRATGKVKDRLVYLNQEESGDIDFVSKFRMDGQYLTGTFVRLNSRHESILKISDLDAEQVDVGRIVRQAGNDNAGTVKLISFFCLYGHTLVMTNARNAMTALKNYLASFIEKNGGHGEFDFAKMIRTLDTLGTNEIKSIELGESAFLNPRFSGSGRSFTTKLHEVSWSVIKGLFSHEITEDEAKRIIRAYLVLKIDQKEIKKDEALRMAMKLVNDENIVVTGRNGRRVKGTELAVIEERDIELTTEGVFNEFMLGQEMKEIARRYNENHETG